MLSTLYISIEKFCISGCRNSKNRYENFGRNLVINFKVTPVLSALDALPE